MGWGRVGYAAARVRCADDGVKNGVLAIAAEDDPIRLSFQGAATSVVRGELNIQIASGLITLWPI